MSVGVYETATVTVIVGVSGGSLQDGSKSPESLAECDSLGALEGFREGCVAGDKMPPSFEPFEGGPEVEGGPGLLFPEAPGLPDRPSGPARSGGLGRQAPPRLECPSAVFLEELETGLVECHAWDASGEEYLEYSWEPVGNTTRDYLDNPRLIPEDSPHPSVVAPEAPVYETLESFHSGERTFRYRYRLTATSRATGLSSSSEVEVFVSSSRPGVYCPLEVVVEEGGDDCAGLRGGGSVVGPYGLRRGRRVDIVGVGGSMGNKHGASCSDGPVVSVVYGSCRQRGRGVPLHSEHDVFCVGDAPYGKAKSDGDGQGGRRRSGH